MAKEREFRYGIGIDDQGSIVFDKFAKVINDGGKQIGQTMAGISNQMDNTGKATNRLSEFIRTQRAEQRQQNFLFQQGKDVIGASSVALGIFGNTIGRTNPAMQTLTNSVNSGYIAFQGLDFLLAGVAGPWGIAIAAAGGIAAAVATMGGNSEESARKIRQLTIDILDLDIKLGNKTSTDKFTLLQQQLAEAQKELDGLQKKSVVEGPWVALIKYVLGTKEAMLQATKEVKNLEVAIDGVVDATADENAEAIRRFMDSLDSDGLKSAPGSVSRLREEQARLQADLNNLVPRTDAYQTKLIALAAVEKELAEEQSNRAYQMKLLNDTTERASLTLQKLGQVAKDSMPEFFTVPKMSLLIDVTASENSLDNLQFKIQEVQAALNAADVGSPEFAKLAADLDRLQQKMNAALIAPIEKFKTQIQLIAGLTSRAFSIMAQASGNAAQAELEDIAVRKESALEKINAELAMEGISDAQKKTLLAERDKLEKKYRAEERAAKQRAFESDKEARIIQAVIDTASAIVEALPDIPLSIIVGALGAAQIGVIAGQPTPKFHQGGTAFIDAPASHEVPILVRGQETVRVTTPEQEQSTRTGMTFILNNYGPISTPEAFKQIVQEGMRQMGVRDVTKYFVENRSKAVLT